MTTLDQPSTTARAADRDILGVVVVAIPVSDLARSAAWYRDLLDLQYVREFGDRDHTTVLFAYRKISAMVARNEGMAEELRQLEQRILADPRNNR